jgi:hypothetical protein
MKQPAKKNVRTPSDNPFPRGVSKPALRALASAGYTSVDQLAIANERELAALHGMGPKALGILRSALKAKGKAFRT